MSAQVTTQSLYGDRTYNWHSVEEILDLASEAIVRSSQLVVFTHRTSTAGYVKAKLEGMRLLGGDGADVEVLTTGTSRPHKEEVMGRFNQHLFDVLVLTDGVVELGGITLPTSTAGVLHAELPPYGKEFRGDMNVREELMGWVRQQNKDKVPHVLCRLCCHRQDLHYIEVQVSKKETKPGYCSQERCRCEGWVLPY